MSQSCHFVQTTINVYKSPASTCLMLWTPSPRRTRSGTEFSPFTPISALCVSSFDFGALLADAVSKEGAEQEDHDHDGIDDLPDAPMPTDHADDINADFPPPAPLNPWDGVDDVSPAHEAPSRPPSPPLKRQRTILNDMAQGKTPLKGNHRRCAAKCAKEFSQHGQAPRASIICNHVLPAAPIPTTLDANMLPTAHGAYAAKVETKEEKWGSKKRRNLSELLAMGFTLVPWNGFDSRPLVDSQGRIFAVLARQPSDPKYAAATERVFQLLKVEGFAAAFPTSLRHH
ncbi:hypothetical protein C8R44DRAFT_894801 [Mycena epipterygia]|nr:hypothetical protein C8R44DRAFT_894801 [Mycena epipterygia]